MLFERGRVEADLEKIRKANLNPAQQKIEDERERKLAENLKEKIGGKDIFAMILAVFSIILPYILVFIAVIGGTLLLLYFLLMR